MILSWVVIRVVATGVKAVFVIIGLSINVDFISSHFYGVAGHSNDALDEIFALVNGIDENNDVLAVGLTDGYQCVANKRDFDAVDEFIDQDMIANQQSRLHGA